MENLIFSALSVIIFDSVIQWSEGFFLVIFLNKGT